MNDVSTAVPACVGEAPLIIAGLSAVENSKPDSEFPGVTGAEALCATHWMDDPSVALLPPIPDLLQPAGLLSESGAEGRKFSPGSHENQKVPISFVPVFVSVTL